MPHSCSIFFISMINEPMWMPADYFHENCASMQLKRHLSQLIVNTARAPCTTERTLPTQRAVWWLRGAETGSLFLADTNSRDRVATCRRKTFPRGHVRAAICYCRDADRQAVISDNTPHYGVHTSDAATKQHELSRSSCGPQVFEKLRCASCGQRTLLYIVILA